MWYALINETRPRNVLFVPRGENLPISIHFHFSEVEKQSFLFYF
jgi:hypothetical protein